METLAKRVKSARGRAGMRQEDLARASGLKQSDISKIENGLILKTTGVVALARALRCDAEWLATGEGDMVSERVWPFALLTPEQVQSLSPEHLATVENVALNLWKTAQTTASSAEVRGHTEPRKSGSLTFQLTTRRKPPSGKRSSSPAPARESRRG